MPRLAACLPLACLPGLLVACARIETSDQLVLAAAQMSPDSIQLEIASVRFPLGDPELTGELWSQIDEQQVPVDVRRRLSANGLRAGLLGNRLPPSLERLLAAEVRPAAEPGIEVTLTDFVKQPLVHNKLLHIRRGETTRFITTGERARHPRLTVLLRDEEGNVRGRTFEKAMGVLSITAFPEPDGRARLEFVPELEHGEPQQRWVPGDVPGVMRVEVGAARQVFEQFSLETSLSPGQILVLSGLPDLPGSLGYHFFTEENSGTVQQKLLLVRLAHTQHYDPAGLAAHHGQRAANGL